MDNKHFEELKADMKEVKNDVSEIKTHLAVYNEQLKAHIEGVIQTRALIRLAEAELEEKIKALANKLTPVEKHVSFVHIGAKVLLYVAIGISGIFGFIKLLVELGLIK